MLPLCIKARGRDLLGMKEAKAMFGGNLGQLHLTCSRGFQLLNQAALGTGECNAVSILDLGLEAMLLNRLQEGHFRGGLLPPAFMQGLVDA